MADRSEKLIVRVVAAIRAGCDSVVCVAERTHSTPASVQPLLTLLVASGELAREKVYRGPGAGPGRSSYRYRLTSRCA